MQNTLLFPCTEHLTSGFGDEHIILCLLHIQLLYIGLEANFGYEDDVFCFLIIGFGDDDSCCIPQR